MRFFKSKLQIILSSAIAILAVAAIAGATTIGTNISTDGTLDVAGNVGIGTTSPSHALSISSASNQFLLSNGSTQLRIGNNGDSIYDVDFDGVDTTSDRAIRFFRRANISGVASLDLTRADGTSGTAVRLSGNTNNWINPSNGGLGIGTTSPYAKFSIANTAVASTTMAIRPYAGQTANIIDIYSSSGTLMSVINSAGNVGIGSTSPNYKFVVETSGAGSYGIVHKTGDAITGTWGDNTIGTYGTITDSNFGLSVADGYPTIVIRSVGGGVGNVGIGVNAGSNTTRNKLSVGGNASFGSGYETSLAPADGMIIKGNVGIGTTSPAATLDVEGYMRLKKNLSQPAACSAANAGALAMNSSYIGCVCNGSSWTFFASSTQACVW